MKIYIISKCYVRIKLKIITTRKKYYVPHLVHSYFKIVFLFISNSNLVRKTSFYQSVLTLTQVSHPPRLDLFPALLHSLP